MDRQADTTYADKEYDDLIRPIKVAAKFVSYWPLKRNHSTSAKLFRTFHTLLMFFMIISMCAAQTADIIHNLDDLDEMTACALMASAFYLSLTRLIVFSLHQKDMLYVVETMRTDWTCLSYEDRIILKEKCLFAFRLAKTFAYMVTFTVGFFAFVPILETFILGKERILPYRGFFFYNQTVSPFYESIYVFNVMGGFIGGGSIIGATTFNLIVIIHGSAKFAILRKKLEMINSNDPDADKDVIACIKDHQNAISFADALERIINVLALAQFVISTGLVCFAGFQATSMMENKARLMQYSMFLNSAILELFMFSFSGNALIDEASIPYYQETWQCFALSVRLSDAVGESAYCSHWIGGTFSRSLQILMLRSKVPSKITAAKFYSMSLQSFSQVLSTSFSYIMFLMTVNEE